MSVAAVGQARPWVALAHQPASGSGQQVLLVPLNTNIASSTLWLRAQ